MGANDLSWVIAGRESGPKARPSHPDWFRSLRDQCTAAEVPFFLKQWGEWAPEGTAKRMGDIGEGLGRYRMVRLGKKAAGATLDCREHRDMPR